MNNRLIDLLPFQPLHTQLTNIDRAEAVAIAWDLLDETQLAELEVASCIIVDSYLMNLYISGRAYKR